MSNIGQAILTIGGAVVGSFFGMPQLGYLLGSLAGQALFPTDLGTVSGPRLNDLRVQASTVGIPIALVYGRFAISGNIIWSSGIIESVKKEKQGGKGGPTQTIKTYTYSVNCAVGVCEGPVGGILRIWADTTLVYDQRPQQEGESLEDYEARLDANAVFINKTEIYTGTEDQLPDPTIESFIGVGNISAFRGLCYVVFSDFQLADYGNRIPNFRFEVVNTPVNTPLWDVSKAQFFGTTYDYSAGTYDNVNYATFNWRYTNSNLPSFILPVYPLVDMLVTTNEGLFVPAVRKIMQYAVSGTDPVTEDIDITQFEYVTDMNPGLSNFVGQTKFAGEARFGYYGNKLYVMRATDVNIKEFDLDIPYVISSAVYNSNFKTLSATGGLSPGGMFIMPDGTEMNVIKANAPYRVLRYVFGTPWQIATLQVGGGFAAEPVNEWTPTGGTVAGALRALDFSDDGLNMYLVYNGGGASPGQIKWYTLTTPFHAETATFGGEFNLTAASGHNDVIGIKWHPDGNRFWVVCGPDCTAPKTVSEYRLLDDAPAEYITLGDIVEDVCLRCGLEESQIDVSELTEEVYGYAIGTVVNGRSAIEPLRSFGWFDCVESVGAVRWPVRGGPVVATLTADDLGAHESGSSRPPSVSTARKQVVELPRRLRVHYAQHEMNYEPGEQSASRLAAGNVEVRDIEVPIAMSDNKAAKIAEVLLYDLWVSRNTHRLALGNEWMFLEPADPITMPIDGRQERVRLVSSDNSLTGVITYEAVRDDDGVYVSYAVASSPAYSGTGGGAITRRGTLSMILLDLPLLRDADNNAGYYVALSAVGANRFSGAALFRSPDGGVTYENVGETLFAATVGTLDAALPAAPAGVIDEGNELYIDGLATDALESVTDASLLAGLNAAAIGADGRWEIVQFRTAELVGSPPLWRLTGLLRGRRGTEWAIGTSEVGDAFVLLDSSLVRIEQNVAGLNASKKHKGVLVGDSLEDSTAVDFTPRGVALKPFSVTMLTVTRDTGDDSLDLTWIRRGRIGAELSDSGLDVPLSEETEAYEVDVVDVSSSPEVVVRTLTSNAPSVSYSVADQTTDFAGLAPAGTVFRAYQISAMVGRGYPAEVTL